VGFAIPQNPPHCGSLDCDNHVIMLPAAGGQPMFVLGISEISPFDGRHDQP
jgi:hypothetical protein